MENTREWYSDVLENSAVHKEDMERIIEATRPPIKEDIDPITALKELKKIYGLPLLSYLIGITEPRRIGRWIKGTDNPSPYESNWLIILFQITQILQARNSSREIRQWFIRPSPYMRDRLPMDVLRLDPEFVKMAATDYLAH